MELNDEQREAVCSNSDKLLVVAPAGTGKTRTASARVKRLVDAGESVLCLTFTHSSRRVLKQALRSRAQVKTIVSWAVGRVRELDDAYTIGDGLPIAQRVCQETPCKPADLMRADVLLSTGSVLPDDLPTVALELIPRYRQALDRSGYLTFDRAVAIASILPPARGLSHIVVDEAQDLTSLQLRLIQAQGVPMTLVGDPGQALFSWAGASPDLLPRLAANGWEKLPLRKTYRIPQQLLKSAVIPAGMELESVRRGGSVKRYTGAYGDLPDLVAPTIHKGDVLLGLTRTGLKRYGKAISAAHPRLSVGTSWGDSKGDVLLSTIHSAKGGEWKRAVITDFLPTSHSLYRPQDTTSTGERNRLAYVASTRASQALIFAEVGDRNGDND